MHRERLVTPPPRHRGPVWARYAYTIGVVLFAAGVLGMSLLDPPVWPWWCGPAMAALALWFARGDLAAEWRA